VTTAESSFLGMNVDRDLNATEETRQMLVGVRGNGAYNQLLERKKGFLVSKHFGPEGFS